jgi:hypothetical protein
MAAAIIAADKTLRLVIRFLHLDKCGLDKCGVVSSSEVEKRSAD